MHIWTAEDTPKGYFRIILVSFFRCSVFCFQTIKKKKENEQQTLMLLLIPAVSEKLFLSLE